MTAPSAPTTEPVVCVVGPTASGKSDLAQLLALELSGEVVSADSMQIYRGMDIGTGKLPLAQREVPHWGLDIVDPGQPYSAALFQAYARQRFDDIASRGRRPVLCGGTGFYVRAAIDDYRFPPGEQQGNPVRDRYRTILEETGAMALWELLRERDPASASAIQPADSKRVVRALELADEGVSYACQKERLRSIGQAVPALFLGIAVEPELLRKRIDNRVDAMVRDGLVDEVGDLLAQGFREGLCAPKAIGYKEIVAYLDGDRSLQDAVSDIKTATHRYAKRQRTWFRKDGRIRWLNGDDGNVHHLAEQALAIVRGGMEDQAG